MKSSLFLAALAIACLAGCKRQPQVAAPAPEAQAPAPAEQSDVPPTAVAGKIVQMGSSIQKAQEAARLQTESQNRTSADIDQAVQAQ